MSPSADEGPAFERRRADWLTVAEARAHVLGTVRKLGSESVPLQEALGRALAEDITAVAAIPPWDNSAMDGYAVRADDIEGASEASPVRLRVVGRILAGGGALEEVAAGEAVRIMTGAPVPRGADSVVRVEDTDRESVAGTVSIHTDRDRGRNVRSGGQDMEFGDVVLTTGTTIHSGVVAVLATLGRAEVEVGTSPTVAILTTGDELRGPDRHEDVMQGRGIPDSNGPMLAACVRAAGGTPLMLDRVPDDVSALHAAIGRAADADALVTVGGASMGEADLVKRVLDGAGFEQRFWRVKMRPGSPMGFGILERAGRAQPVFGLPGNPASAFVTFELFVRPWLRSAAGHDRVDRRTVRAEAGAPLSGATGLAFYMRVRLIEEEGALRAYPTGPQGSGLVRGLADAEGLALVPPLHGRVEEGAVVEVLLLDSEGAVPSAYQGALEA